MKKSDFIFLLVAIAIFLPFFVSDAVYEWYKSFNTAHGMTMSFLKFAILSTMGEMIGLRISTGVYINRTFGVIPRMAVWGLLGMGINMAMIIFSKGVPMFMEYTHNQLRRFGKGIGYSHPHETDYHRTELGGALGIRIQENHSSVLVSGTHHHFPAPTNYESIICCRIRHRIGSVTGRRSQKEINILSS